MLQLANPVRLRDERSPDATRTMWYIHAIGTLPQYQGTGQAKALLKHIEARARAYNGKMALLAISQRNESLLFICQIAFG